jgi:metal-responsive CopG/Arc/MetJ family transcriptional regulator
MQRTTISIPDELLQRLRVMAAERRTSIAALVREALEEKNQELSSTAAKLRNRGIQVHRHRS